MQTWALIVDSFRYTIHRRVFWVMIVISLVIAAAMAGIGFDETGATIFFKWHLDEHGLRAGTDAQRSLVAEILIYWVMDKYIGQVGLLLALISTAGIFPSMMETGAIDVVASKPLARARLFLGKYLGSMTFVFLQTTVFVVLTFLVVGIRWKQWLWPYLWSIPLFVILFSYIYVWCVLFAVRMRSSLGPLLLSLACWFVFFAVQSTSSVLQVLPMVEKDSTIVKAANVARWAVPRTQDIPHIAARLIEPEIAERMLGRAAFDDMPEDDRRDMEHVVEGTKKVMSFDIFASLGSSLAIEVLVLGLAVWFFTRRDF